MTDEDLMLLHKEEMRLYGVYVKSMGEEARYPKKIAAKRAAWIALQQKLQHSLSPAKLRELLQEQVTRERKVKR